MTSALVLLSGGLDSTTCLYWAKQRFANLYAISFAYGQRHSNELEYAMANAVDAGVKEHIVVEMPRVVGRSALTDRSMVVDGKHPMASHLPATFTPGRNITFLAIAAGKAFDRGVHDLVTGVCATDATGYPDCRVSFVSAMEMALEEGLGHRCTIHAPLLELTKAETWRLGADLGIVGRLVTNTLTDYNGDETLNEWGRGKEDNPASILRAEGYYQAKSYGWIQ